MQENESPIVVGQLGGVHGVRGWLKLNSYTRPKENIFNYSPLLMHTDDVWQTIDIEEYQQRGERLLVKLSGIDNPEDARKYTKCELAVSREHLPALKEGEYYWCDLIGLEVLNQDNKSLGKVDEIVETGANDVLVIVPSEKDKARVLVPLIMDVYVKKVDLIANTLHVDWQLD
jgi:16S rRNA processing protein RimM